MSNIAKPDVRIHGSGIVSRALGLALARQGLAVAVDARPPASVAAAAATPDVRTYALNAASVALLAELKVWDALASDARCAVHDMQVAGDAGGQISFSAWQQAVPQLAWIVDAAALEDVLDTAARFMPGLQLVPADDAPGSPLPGGPGAAPLTVLAEGKASARREALGIGFERHAYGHTALAARLTTDQAHGGCARQWFRSPDVLALLPFHRPLPESSYGLVWSLPADRAAELAAAPVEVFEAALAEATGGAAGTLRLGSARACWPLMNARADALVGPGWALVGDAAHVMHPLAGQGLNVGLGDVIALAQVLAARERWRPVGDLALLRRYARARQLPIAAMTGVVDGLWQLFSNEHPLARELRNRGLGLVQGLAPLKRFLVGRALQS